MTKVIPALVIAGCLAGCAVDGQPRNDASLVAALAPSCADTITLTVSNFAYSESFMRIIPLTKVRPKSGFLIRLAPRGGFDDAQITVTGTSANAGWISGTGRADMLSNRLLFVGCSPDDPDNTNYKFEIKVEKGNVKNLLDPRARLIR